jgi:hypothetical protein
LARFDELSPDGRALLDAILEAKTLMPPLIEQLLSLGEAESERILIRIMRRAKSEQWERTRLVQALHIPKAFPVLGRMYINLMAEMPPARRSAPLIPLVREEEWAREMLERWAKDEHTPQPTKRAITELERE